MKFYRNEAHKRHFNRTHKYDTRVSQEVMLAHSDGECVNHETDNHNKPEVIIESLSIS
jgi:hypothetical protein